MSFFQKTCCQVAIVATFLIMTGCAATSTFTAYPRKIQPLITSMSNRSPIDLSQCLISECKSKDLILYNMEVGRYAHVIGNLDISMSDFRTSMARIKENDEKALISASDIGANVAATLVNDNAIPYEGEGYERVLLHHYQALNYLQKKDIEGAGVEVRRANAEQNESLKRFEDELQKSRDEASEKRIDTSNDISRIDTQYAQMDEVAGKVKNSFQNAYTFYVSGFIYELLQQPNDAYIDYKKALEIYPENRYLQKDVLRLAAKLEMGDDLVELKRRFPAGQQQFVAENGAESGELLVLFEDGFVPQKHQIKISLPINNNFVSVAFPIYQEKWSPQVPLQILNRNELLGSTEPICDVRALAVKALKEKAPVIATRQIIRAVAKAVAAAQAKKKMGDLGQLAANVWNLVSESADLRSWLTLPANAQILRTTLPAGNYKLALQHPMTGRPTYADVNITAEGKTVLQVVRAGQEIYTSAVQF